MFIIYGQPNCVWCERARQLLTSKGYTFEYHDITSEPKALAEFKFLFKEARSVPQIATGLYDEVKVIGGYEDLVSYLRVQKA